MEFTVCCYGFGSFVEGEGEVDPLFMALVVAAREFDSFFGSKKKVLCPICGSVAVSQKSLWEDATIVKCKNPQCATKLKFTKSFFKMKVMIEDTDDPQLIPYIGQSTNI